MVLPRPTALRNFSPARLLRAAPRTANRAVARRGYASSHGEQHSASSSDMPWLISAIAVTVPSCYYLWPSGSHADAHHDHAETSAERAEKLTHGEEKSNAADDEEEEQQQEDEPKQAKSDEEKGEPAESTSAPNTEGENMPEDKGDVEGVQFKGKTKQGDEENRMPDERKVEDDGKGGKKLRIDSGSAKDLGAGPQERDDGSESAATAKTPKGSEGDISSKQAGLSNTPTRHSTDITEDPYKSKKGEGTPETAKSMGTVSVDRPHTELKKGEDKENNPNSEKAEEKSDE